MTSFYTSLNALRNAETDLSVIAHNIANAETLAFKSRSVQFADIVAGGTGNDPRLSVGLGATVSTINQDFSLGAIEQTGRSLDVAIDSEGFFAEGWQSRHLHRMMACWPSVKGATAPLAFREHRNLKAPAWAIAVRS